MEWKRPGLLRSRRSVVISIDKRGTAEEELSESLVSVVRRLRNEHLVGSYPLMEGIPNIRLENVLIRKVIRL